MTTTRDFISTHGWFHPQRCHFERTRAALKKTTADDEKGKDEVEKKKQKKKKTQACVKGGCWKKGAKTYHRVLEVFTSASRPNLRLNGDPPQPLNATLWMKR